MRVYSEFYLSGDGDSAYTLVSTRCQAKISLSEYEDLAAAAKARYGGQQIKSLTVDSVDGSAATVSYTYASSEIDQKGQRWVREDRGALDSGWHYDQC